jgi:predicted enzyme related to lactoylglutathione lyase
MSLQFKNLTRGATVTALMAVSVVAGIAIGNAQGQASGASPMEKVTGIGGIAFRSADPKATMAWYAKHLGINAFKMDGKDTDFALFQWKELDKPDNVANTVWSPIKQGTNYFEPSTSEFIINYRVRDLDSLLTQLRAASVQVVAGPTTDFNGRFAWIMDPDGRKVELWEPGPGF